MISARYEECQTLDCAPDAPRAVFLRNWRPLRASRTHIGGAPETKGCAWVTFK